MYQHGVIMNHMRTILNIFIIMLIPLTAFAEGENSKAPFWVALETFYQSDCTSLSKPLERGCYIIKWDSEKNKIIVGKNRNGEKTNIDVDSFWYRGPLKNGKSIGEPKTADTGVEIFKIFGENYKKGDRRVGRSQWYKSVFDFESTDNSEGILELFNLDDSQIEYYLEECVFNKAIDGCKRIIFLTKEFSRERDEEGAQFPPPVADTPADSPPATDTPPVSPTADSTADTPSVADTSADTIATDTAPPASPSADTSADTPPISPTNPPPWIYIFIAMCSLVTILFIFYLSKRTKLFIADELSKIKNTEPEPDGNGIAELKRDLRSLNAFLVKLPEAPNKTEAPDTSPLLRELIDETNKTKEIVSNDIVPSIQDVKKHVDNFSSNIQLIIGEKIKLLEDELDSYFSFIPKVESKLDSYFSFIKEEFLSTSQRLSGLSAEIISGLSDQSAESQKKADERIRLLGENFEQFQKSTNDNFLTGEARINALSDTIKAPLEKIPELLEFSKNQQKIIEDEFIAIHKRISDEFPNAMEKVIKKAISKIEMVNEVESLTLYKSAKELNLGICDIDKIAGLPHIVLATNVESWEKILAEAYNELMNWDDPDSRFCKFVLDQCHFKSVLSMVFEKEYLEKMSHFALNNDKESFINILNDYSTNRISIRILPTILYAIENMLCPIVNHLQTHPMFEIRKILNQVVEIFRLTSEKCGIFFHYVPAGSNFLSCGEYMERAPKASILIHQIIRSEPEYQEVFKKWLNDNRISNGNENRDVVIDVINLGYSLKDNESLVTKTIVTTYHDIEGKF